MDSIQTSVALQALAIAGCIVAAVIALIVGYRLYRPEQLDARTRRSGLLGSLLMLSSLPWLGLAFYQATDVRQTLALMEIEDLPATAAGIAPEPEPQQPDTATRVASVATLAEELAANPQHPDFQLLRNRVISMLYSNYRFGQYPQPILLNLPSDRDAEAIRYLAEERPGLLTVIYHSREGGEQRMLVYWPEVAGQQLIYTPLSGPSTQAVSQLVQDALTR